MRQTILFLAGLFLFFALPQNTFAQGTYDCTVTGAACVPNYFSSKCDKGFVPNSTGCNQGNIANCNNIKNLPCIDDVTISGGVTSEDKDKLLCGDESINTAVGCIPFGDTTGFVGFVLRWAIGIGGGIAFLLILVAGFQIMSSSGDPERLKAGQELLTSAISGLLLLIFSVFILQLVGVQILNIPGFSSNPF